MQIDAQMNARADLINKFDKEYKLSFTTSTSAIVVFDIDSCPEFPRVYGSKVRTSG
jgi:hypothetical protein